MQGCVEIIYISLQTIIFTAIVYWMCWFQRDAGEQSSCMCCPHSALKARAMYLLSNMCSLHTTCFVSAAAGLYCMQCEKVLLKSLYGSNVCVLFYLLS